MNRTFVVGIENGCFTVRVPGMGPGLKTLGPCPLTAEALAGLLREGGCTYTHDHIMCSSSMDFPQDDGAPRGFEARAVLRRAVEILRTPPVLS